MRLTIFHISFLLLCFSQLAYTQNQHYQFTRLNRLDEASIGKVNFITEDQYGFIWFSEESNNALTRFDGFDIKRYQNDPNDDNSLGGYHPECLLVDKEGIIWVGFFGDGMDRFDPQNETFTHYDHDPNNNDGLSNDYISSILEGPDGKIYIATFDGLDVLDPGTNTFEHYKHDPEDETSLSSNTVRELYLDRSGTIWVGTGWFSTGNDLGGLNMFDPKQRNFTRYLADPSDPNSLKNRDVSAIYEDSKGNFWVGTLGDGLHLMDRNTGHFQHFPYDPDKPDKISVPPFKDRTFGVTFISEDQAGNLWIGGEGIDVYNPESGFYRHFGDNQDYDGTFIENSSWCIHMSSNGMIWVSTQPGVYKVDPLYFTIPLMQEAIPLYLIESDSVYWKGSRDGIVKVNQITNRRSFWRHDPDDRNSLCSGRIRSIYQDARGDTWVGTETGLTRIFNENGRTISYYHDPLDPNSLSINSVTAIIEDGNQVLWVGTTSGLNRFDKSRNKIERIGQIEIDSFPTNIDLNIAFLELGNPDELWIGHNLEGNAFKLNTKTMKVVRYSVGNAQSDIHKDSSGRIWIASQGGIHRYDESMDIFHNLVDYSVYDIVADRESKIWANAVGRILEINEDGQIMEFEAEAVRRLGNISGYPNGTLAPDGKVLLGDNLKYYYFDPKKIQKPQDTSSLFFMEMAVVERSSGDRMSIPLRLDSLNDIDLNYNENSFYLKFAEIDYRERYRNKIQYRLVDYDAVWRQTFSEEEVSYSNVPPGQYILQIKAVNSSSNLWAHNELYLKIAPPWWRTNWAYLAYFLLFIGSLITASGWQRKRLLRIEEEKAQLKELEHAKEIEKAYKNLKSTQAQLIQSEKMASLGELTAGIAHEIQNPLNFVNNFSEVNTELIEELEEEIRNGDLEEIKAIAKDLRANEEKINHHGKRADAIVKGMLQHSRTRSGEKVPTDLNELVDEYLRLAYHGLRAKDSSFNAAFETNFDPDLPKVEVIPQDIGRVLLNLINNAFQAVDEKSKTGVDGNVPKVKVTTVLENDQVVIRIEDNGPGIPDDIKDKIFQPFFTTKPTGQGTGLGLSLSYDIVKAHGGELKADSDVGEGSVFQILLPIA